MNRIISPLNPGTQGQAVADLQDGLVLLLNNSAIHLSEADRQAFEEGLRAERTRSIYGDATHNLVGHFQQQHNLTPNGLEDEPTARVLNDILEQLGAFDSAAPCQQRLVGGQVWREDGEPFPDGLVRAFHVGEQGVLRLGEDTTDSEGRYTIHYTSLPGGDAVHLSVEVFDTDGKPLRASDPIQEATPLEVVDLEVPSTGVATFLVEGEKGLQENGLLLGVTRLTPKWPLSTWKRRMATSPQAHPGRMATSSRSTRPSAMSCWIANCSRRCWRRRCSVSRIGGSTTRTVRTAGWIT